jgi:hypothetical protein
MKAVQERIAQRQREFAQIPFFAFLRDDTIPAAERLAFAPYIASFVMGFGDFNKYVIRDPASDDPWQKVVNEHTLEDDHHWLWYLDDLRKLGRSDARPFVDALRFLWGDHTSKARMFMYQLCGLAYGASPLLRLAITQAIEGTGFVFFDAVAPAAKRYTEETGTSLVYFGRFHMERETGHVMASGDALAAVESLVLPDAIRPAAYEAVDVVFAAAIAFNEEIWANVQKDRRRSDAEPQRLVTV